MACVPLMAGFSDQILTFFMFFEAAGPDFEAAGPDCEAAGPDFEAAGPDSEANFPKFGDINGT